MTCPAKDKCVTDVIREAMCRTKFSMGDIDSTEEQSESLEPIHVDTADTNTRVPGLLLLTIMRELSIC